MVNRITKHNFLGKVIILAGGTAAGQALVVLISPVLTRLYSPEDFGMFAVFLALVSTISAVCGLRYELAIPLPKDEQHAVQLTILAIGLVSITSFLFWLGCLTVSDQMLQNANIFLLKPYLWLIPVTVWGSGIYLALTYWAIRKQNFNTIANTRIVRSFGIVFGQTSLGLLQSSPVGLLVGYIIGQLLGIGKLFKSFVRESRPLFDSITLKGILATGIRYKKFPILACPAFFFKRAGMQLPSVFLAYFYGLEVAGLFALTQRVLRMPASLIGNAVSQVFVSEGAKLLHSDKKKFQRLFKRVSKKLMICSIVVAIFVALVAWLFPYIFGTSWERAGKYAYILIPVYMFNIIVHPISQTANILERQGAILIVDVIGVIIIFFSIAGSSWLKQTDLVAVSSYMIAMCLYYFSLYAVSWKTLQNHEDRAF